MPALPAKRPRVKAPRAPAAQSAPGRSRAMSADQTSLLATLATLIEPMAKLAVAKGAPLAAVQDLMKMAFVDAARNAHPDLQAHGAVSRISTVTGLHRREVARVMQLDRAAVPTRRSPAAQVFTRWQSDPDLKNRRGEPRPLPRQGPAPSFDALVQAVTRDVHPRSLLDELVRLGLVELSADGETVRLVRNAFVPRGDAIRMFSFLGSNVGDHLSASVANVLADAPPHFEQALFADELSVESLQAVRSLITAQWQALMQAVVPAVNALLDADREAAQTSGRRTDQRLRVGLYSYHEAMPAPPSNESEES